MSKVSSKVAKTRAQTESSPEAGDILRGGNQITEYLRVLMDDPDLPRGTVYRWLAENYLPHSSIGALKTASKATLKEHLSRAAVAGLKEIAK